MSEPPTARGVVAFIIGCALVLSLAEQPLWALAAPERNLLDRINEVRAEHHLGALRPLEPLARVAQAHADDMVGSDYFAHVSPAGQNALDRVQAAGIEGFRLLAENLGSSTVSGDRIGAIIRAWMESPVHRENVLNPAFNTSGIGFGRTGAGELIVVQLYATFTESP